MTAEPCSVTLPDERRNPWPSPIIDRSGLDMPVMVLDDPALPTGEALVARIVARSVDGAISGTATTSVTLC
jgi:hypothetical protein